MVVKYKLLFKDSSKQNNYCENQFSETFSVMFVMQSNTNKTFFFPIFLLFLFTLDFCD